MYKNAYLVTLSCLVAVVCMLMSSCTENVDMSARYVFKEQTAISYLEKYPEHYSEYVKLLKIVPVSKISKTTVAQLLSARGNYTIFAPTNEAIAQYLDTLVTQEVIPYASWDAFTDSTKLDSIRKVIVYNSIIDGGDENSAYDTGHFPVTNGAELTIPNMADHKLSVFYSRWSDSIKVNNKYNIDIRNRDILVINGYIHMMSGVVAPRDVTATLYLEDIIEHQRPGFLVMARAIIACGLKDTLNKIRDEKYEEMYQCGNIRDLTGLMAKGVDFNAAWAPEHRKYGFTIFAEPDTYWQEQGLDPTDPDLLKSLQQWIADNHQYSNDDKFTTDEDYKNPNNLLYQWVTYHILPERLAVDRLVTHWNEVGYNYENPSVLSIPVYEIYTTMGKRRLMKIYESKESDGVYLNRFPNLDNGRTGTYQELSCDMDKVGCRVGRDDERAVISDIINAIIYPIDTPLSYNDETRNNLMKQRLRYDAQSLFPELINNDIRSNTRVGDRNTFTLIPSDNTYHYLENAWVTDDTYLVAIRYHGGNPSFNADEMKAGGYYDVTIKLPPVPRRGTYEFRYAVLNMPYRGVCQTYLSEDLNNRVVTGIPIDMTKNLWAFGSGYEEETEDQDYNAEVDKRMRSLGYMKGCMMSAPKGVKSEAMRVNMTYSCMRVILTTMTLDPDKTYYVTFKNVLDYFKELYLDYFEWCAKEVYDNPDNPEDIW